MEKCSICNRGKGKRFCPPLNRHICPFCCGSKRQKEIPCFSGCEHLKTGSAYQMEREIAKEISESFQTETDDIFNSGDERIFEFVEPLEKFFVKNFYENLRVNDSDIYIALVKIYAHQTGKSSSLTPDNKCQQAIFEQFQKIDQATLKLSQDLKAKLILRILKSIRDTSGGIFGNRNYLKLIYSQFYKDGQWSDLFRCS